MVVEHGQCDWWKFAYDEEVGNKNAWSLVEEEIVRLLLLLYALGVEPTQIKLLATGQTHRYAPMMQPTTQQVVSSTTWAWPAHRDLFLL
jgi:hypothetical protein